MKVQTEHNLDYTPYYLIAYQKNGSSSVSNIVTMENPVEFIIRNNKNDDKQVAIINFWILTYEEYEHVRNYIE